VNRGVAGTYVAQSARAVDRLPRSIARREECSRRGVASPGVASSSSHQNEANAPAPVGGWIDSDSGIALEVSVTNISRSRVVVSLGGSMSGNVVIS